MRTLVLYIVSFLKIYAREYFGLESIVKSLILS